MREKQGIERVGMESGKNKAQKWSFGPIVTRGIFRLFDKKITQKFHTFGFRVKLQFS
jgi:hypothetical protein